MLRPINDLQLHVERAGAGPPLLLLHGFTGSADEWAALVAQLAAQHELIAVDLIGHGRSSAPADLERYSMEHCVADLLALLGALGLGRIDLLGYSMGGRVALQLATAAPARIKRLVLESTSPGLADPAERAARVASDNALADRIEADGLAWFVEYWAAIPLFSSQAALPAEQRTALRERRLRGSAHGYANSLRGMGAGRQAPLWARLPTLAIPTLLISGELDVKYAELGQRMAALLPDVRHTIIGSAGHAAHLEQPEAFAQLVVEYLQTAP